MHDLVLKGGLVVHGTGVRVNVRAPRGTATDMRAVHDNERLHWRIDRHPVGRFGTPDDSSNLDSCLACDEVRWGNGAVFVIDGGATVKYL